MQTLMIKDLSRNDELTVEEMKSIRGGVAGVRLLGDTYEPVGGKVGVSYNSTASTLDAIFKAASTAAQRVG